MEHTTMDSTRSSDGRADQLALDIHAREVERLERHLRPRLASDIADTAAPG